jgi:tetratricopeptide (TPR) repeat protein
LTVFVCLTAFAQEPPPAEPPEVQPKEEPKEEPKEKPEEQPKEEPEKPAVELEWLSGVEEGLKKAKEKGIDLLVLFTNPDRCPPCRQLEAQTIPDKDVHAFLATFVLVKMDAWDQGKGSEAAKKHVGNMSIPTILVFGPNGKEKGRISGFRPPEVFVKDLTAIRDADKNIEEGAKLIKDKPEDPAGYLQAIKGYKAKGKLDEAIENYKKLIELDPKNEKEFGAEAYEKLAEAFEQKRDLNKAAETLQKLIELDPKNEKDLAAGAYEKLADMYARNNRFDKAVENAEKLIELDPDNKKGLVVKAYDKLARYYGMARNIKKALEYLDKVIELDSENKWDTGLNAAFQLGRYHTSNGEIEKAKKYLDIIKKMDPEDKEGCAVGIAWQIGRYYVGKGDAENAKKFFDIVKESDPQGKKVHKDEMELNLAIIPAIKQKWDEAVKNIEAFIESHKESKFLARAYIYLANVYGSAGKEEKAREILKEIVEKFPKSQEAAWAKRTLQQMK